MSSPAHKQVAAEFDPLSPTATSSMSTSPTDHLATSSPVGILQNATGRMSFKKRTGSRSTGARAGLLGGILSRSNEDESVIPPPAAAVGGPGSRSDPPTRISMPNSPFKVPQSVYSNALDSDEEDEEAASQAGGARSRQPSLKWTRSINRVQGRRSFGANSGFSRQPPLRNPLLLSPGEEARMGGRRSAGEEEQPDEEAPVAITPLPVIPIIVLCLALFGEFLSASLSSPFLYFMIESFGVGAGPDGGGEATVGFWTGVVSSAFFLSQFLTSMLWVSVAEKHGRRAVLFASLLGNGLTVMAFGTSKNLQSAITIRFAMGVFNGAVGVARSAVQNITDSTNESRAFTYMGLCWGLGGIVGSILGGLLESPVKNHPRWFSDDGLFASYPYLLPCLVAGSVTTSGAVLSLFLNPDGGPRTGSIQLPSEKDLERATRSFGSNARSLLNRLVESVRGSQGVKLPTDSNGTVPLHSSAGGMSTPDPALSPVATPPAADERSPFAHRRPSKFGAGSAYGYSTRQPSEAGEGLRIPSGRRYTSRSNYRSMSVATSNAYAPDYDVDRGNFSFAQRLLLANEQAVFSISDLWVAKATREADDFSQVDYEESVFEDEESRVGESRMGDESPRDLESEPDFFGYGSAPPSIEDLRGHARRQGDGSGYLSPALTAPGARGGSRSPSQERSMMSPARERAASQGGPRLRRASIASSAPRGVSIFANTGLDDETLAASQAQGQASAQAYRTADESAFNPMAAIPETERAPSVVEHDTTTPDNRSFDEKPPQSLLRQLPLAMIAQHSLLALHGCTCDQVFMSFLVTPVPSGGLGLKAANYAALVAAMFVFSMIWQFRFYPFVGPPNGSLSHLAMFRLGLLLYLPVYILFPELRGLLRESGNSYLVMFGMVLLSSIRYLANTCSYTAVMVLVNAMSPPHLVPLANGLAQSTVSLARFIGPLVGGTVWAYSIRDGPSAHSWPWNYALGFIAIAVLCFLGFLHSLRIH